MIKKKNGKSIVKRSGIENDNRYEGVMRVEVRLRNRKLNYEKYSNGVAKELQNYYNEETQQEFFRKHIEPIFGTSRFYRIDVAKRIVCESNLTDKWKSKLCNLLEDINKNGYSKGTETYNNTTLRNYKKKLDELGINCLTFDEHFKQESMDNFTLIENGTNTDLEEGEK